MNKSCSKMTLCGMMHPIYLYNVYIGVFWWPEELNDNCVETKCKGNNGYRLHFNGKLKDAW